MRESKHSSVTFGNSFSLPADIAMTYDCQRRPIAVILAGAQQQLRSAPFGHNRHGPKIEELCPFGGGTGSPSNTM